jgi:hypothetical protein
MVCHFCAISIICCFRKGSRVCSARSSHSRALARYSSALDVRLAPVCALHDERRRRRVVPQILPLRIKEVAGAFAVVSHGYGLSGYRATSVYVIGPIFWHLTRSENRRVVRCVRRAMTR